jgi:hypothetical protein
MSLVENLVNQISTNGLGGVTKPQGFDLNDPTFDNLLQKAMGNNAELNDKLQILGNLGQPAGIIIEPFDGTSAIKPIGQENYVNTEPIQIKDVDLGNNYFSGLLKDSPLEHKSLMNVAKKHASTAYNVFGKTLVENLTDFANDVKSLM